MDNQEIEERERSEPCSARANPFVDDEQNGSRKRQRRVRSSSVDTTTDLDRSAELTPTPTPSIAVSNIMSNVEHPQTPPSMSTQSPPEPTSSRVTLNLRANKHDASIPSWPSSPSDDGQSAVSTQPRKSVESENEAVSLIPVVETPSSSTSASGSPEVELVTMIEEDTGFDSQDPPMAIIDEEEIFLDIDPMMDFPYCGDEEALVDAVIKVARFLQYGNVNLCPPLTMSDYCRGHHYRRVLHKTTRLD